MKKLMRKLLDFIGASLLLGPWGRKKAKQLLPAADLQELDLPSLARAVVFAPHPDDEVFGAGLLLKRLVEAAETVTVVYVTNGQKYAARSDGDRVLEAKALAAKLGVKAIFLNFNDGELLENEDALAIAVATCLVGVDLAVTPAYNDYHLDHRVLAKAVLMGAENDPSLKVLMYCTCAPLWPDHPIHYLAGDFAYLEQLFEHYPASAAPSVVDSFRVLRVFQARRYLGEKIFWEPYWQLAGPEFKRALEAAKECLLAPTPFLTATRHWSKFIGDLGKHRPKGERRERHGAKGCQNR